MSFWEPLIGSKESWRKMSWPLRVFMGVMVVVGIMFVLYAPLIFVPLGVAIWLYQMWKKEMGGS